MVPQATAARLLETLPPRPPTPPRESEHNATQPSFLQRIFSPARPKQTPVKSTSNSNLQSLSSERQRKKVEWSAWTDYKDPPKLFTKENTVWLDSPRPIPSSADRKAPKSILKPYHAVSFEQTDIFGKSPAPSAHANFAIMLESITKQLAGEDRGSRIDAYTTLSNVLKASDNVPDIRALKEKMGLLMQFLQRDVSAKLPSGTADSVLINNALVLLSSFLYRQVIADLLTADFCVFIVDHAISAFESTKYSKDVVKHLMFVVAHQNFSPKVMTADKMSRLLVALHNIESQVKGKSIVNGRIHIYRKLLKQARSSMIAKTEWIGDLLTDMLSSFKDIRTQAIAFGLEAAQYLGSEKQPSRGVMDLFKLQREEGRFGDYYVKRLLSMVRLKQDGASVPQIWSVVILFLRCYPHQLDRWEFMKPWLVVIQECFNSPDVDTKIQANYAWNRLIYAIRPDADTAPSMIKMLTQPLAGQLKKNMSGKQIQDARKSVMGSVCNLLYYSLKPGAMASELDLYWDEYVNQLVGKILVLRQGFKGRVDKVDSSADDLTYAIAIVTRLLDPSSPRMWKEARALEVTALTANDLPSLDPRWIRKNPMRVFAILKPIIERSYESLADETSNISCLWKAYIRCISLAGAKEIKVSNDTMVSMTYVLDFLSDLWIKGPGLLQIRDPNSETQGTFLSSYNTLLSTFYLNLGPLPFTEKPLVIGPEDTTSSTGSLSQRLLMENNRTKSPLSYMISLLVGQPGNTVSAEQSFISMVRSFLHPFLEARGPRQKQLELIKDLSQLLSDQTTEACDNSQLIWSVLAEATTLALPKENESGSGSGSSSSLEHSLGGEYRDINQILNYSLGMDSLGYAAWLKLFNAVIESVSEVAGDGGRAIAVIEPLSKAVIDRLQVLGASRLMLNCSSLVLSARFPKDRRSLEAARRRLWGTAVHTSSSLDPYNHLYTLLGTCLGKIYSEQRSDASAQLLSATSQLFSRVPQASIVPILTKTQHGLAYWIRDRNQKLPHPSNKDLVFKEVRVAFPFLS
jgi:hypothetical protein